MPNFKNQHSPIGKDTFTNDENQNSYIISINEEEKLLLAKLIHAEAEGEPQKGKIAVGAVVVNRILHPDFPDTILEVIMEPDQFETVSNNRLMKISEPNEESLEAAEKALRGLDPTDGALFFYNPKKTTNKWIKAKKVKLALGDHLFVV